MQEMQPTPLDAINTQRAVTMARRRQQTKQSFWEDLMTAYNECRAMFTTLIIYPQKQRELKPLATDEENRVLNKVLQNLQADCKKASDALEVIFASHSTNGVYRKGLVADALNGDDLFTYLQIAGEYRSWMENFQTLITQPVNDFVVIADQITNRNKTSSL